MRNFPSTAGIAVLLLAAGASARGGRVRMSFSPYGLLELPWWGYVLVTFVTIETMFLGVTLYLHRDQSHGGLILHPALRHVFRFWLWFSSAAITKEWVAVHRRHHAYADQRGRSAQPGDLRTQARALRGLRALRQWPRTIRRRCATTDAARPMTGSSVTSTPATRTAASRCSWRCTCCCSACPASS